MPFMFDWLYGRMGRFYFSLFQVFELASAMVITLATVGLFSLYEDMSSATFWRTVLIAEACVLVAVGYSALQTRRLARPLRQWLKGGRDPAGAAEAWRQAVSLPRRMVGARGWLPFVLACLPIAIYITLELGPAVVRRAHHRLGVDGRGRLRRGAALLRLRAVPAACDRGHRSRASRRLGRPARGRTAALEAARRAAAHQRDHRGRRQRPVRRRAPSRCETSGSTWWWR